MIDHLQHTSLMTACIAALIALGIGLRVKSTLKDSETAVSAGVFAFGLAYILGFGPVALMLLFWR